MGTLYRRSSKGNWHAEYTNHAGKRIQRSTRTANRKVAQQLLAHWEIEEAKRIGGMIDPQLERVAQQSLRPIADHVKEFMASLESAGRSKVHRDRTKKRIDAIADHAGWHTASDITAESVERYAAYLREQKRSNQTVAHYLQAAKQLTRWMYRTDRLRADPLKTISKPNPKTDRRWTRRMLLPAEWPWLRDAAGQRAVIYQLAIETGLRSSEVRSLRPSQIHQGKHPYVTVKSGDTKDAKAARQYITVDLAGKLKRHKPRSKDQLFELPPDYDMADMVRGDLARARATWEKTQAKKTVKESDFLLPGNDAGEWFDFHSLRHTCGAWLAIQGVHPKTIQTVMRHKSITLTMDTYGHLFPGAEPEAISKIGDLMRQ